MSTPPPEPPAAGRTALVVVVPEADPLVAEFRLEHHRESVARRIPPPVTVLFPFVPQSRFGAAVRADLRALTSALAAFEAELTRVATFAGDVWLAPAPRKRFVALIRRVCEDFPADRPYGGAHADPEPHLTVGQAASAAELAVVAAAARRRLAPGLPLSFRVDALTVLAEGDDRSWSTLATFPFAGA